MGKFLRTTLLIVGGLAILAAGTACSEIAPPDQIGLYYLEGNSDGYKFDHCIDPGKSDDALWNNSVVLLPNNLRTWNIAPKGGDSTDPIVVASKPEANQPSGVQVNVWTQTNFYLNTVCDGGATSPIVQFWEKVGRRYGADTTEGWTAMLESTVVTALTTATRNIIRTYSADELVAGTNLTEVQEKIAAAFQVELKRLVGGDFFCGPTFNRVTKTCPPVEVIVKDVDYNDPGIQQARNAKQKAIEQAQALVAEAQGKLDAANTEKQLYNNPAWVQLELAKLKLQQVQACASNPNCTVVVGSDGGVIVNSK